MAENVNERPRFRTEVELTAFCLSGGGAWLSEAMRAGEDPLGDAFSSIRSPGQRRAAGATYTPARIVTAMTGLAKRDSPDVMRVVDCGAGSGRFSIAFANAYSDAQVVAVESDPLACSVLRKNLSAAGLRERVTVVEGDFLDLELPRIEGQTLFAGNPPYVRHHDIDPGRKAWLTRTAGELGLRASGLCGLHVYFFLKIASIAREGDAGILITSSEWLETSYGRVVRELLAGRLGGTRIHAVDPQTRLFADAQVTSAITSFRVGVRSGPVLLSRIRDMEDIADAAVDAEIPRNSDAGRSWLDRGAASLPPDMARIGEFFSVSRGQVTGGNSVWIAGKDTPELPERYLVPCVTKAADLISAGPALTDTSALRRVVVLPPDLAAVREDERAAVAAFLAWAEERGGRDSFTARSRKSWWHVPFKAAAPILCTYMGRRPPVFVRNTANVPHVNIAHGLYPRRPMEAEDLDAVARWLADHPATVGGRTYGGGLRKFEPREIESLALPRGLFDPPTA